MEFSVAINRNVSRLYPDSKFCQRTYADDTDELQIGCSFGSLCKENDCDDIESKDDKGNKIEAEVCCCDKDLCNDGSRLAPWFFGMIIAAATWKLIAMA